MQLWIGNKNYSSWSLRPWLLMREAGIPFEEKRLRLAWEPDSDFKRTLLAMAPTGRVPLLIDDDGTACCMTLEARLPEGGARLLAEDAATKADLARVDALFAEALAASGGPFLFGERFGIADAFYAPVCTRLRTYALPVSAPAQAYVDRILALPSFLAWEREALAEHDWIAEDEPYRRQPG